MNFFTVSEPYYALIKADNLEDAIQEYVHAVADNEDKEVEKNIKQISKDEALIRYTRCITKTGDHEETQRILNVVNSPETMTLIIDANLL